MKFCVSSLLAFALLVFPVRGFETDQFNLPPEPLADIGGEVSLYVRANIEKALLAINTEITEREKRLQNTARNKRGEKENLEAELKILRSPQKVEREIYNLLGKGFPPFTASDRFIESHKFTAQPARFKPDFSDSIYKVFPLNHFTLSSTVNLYGVSLGSDKIAHIFQQGYTYRQIKRKNQAKDLSEKDSVQKAVNWGKMSEKTFYGYWVSGVYSNADLAANYLGMKFYENLSAETNIGGKAFAPILELREGLWKFRTDEDFFRRFISNRLSEAWNPSIYSSVFGLFAFVKKKVKTNSCPQWKKTFPQLTKTDYEKIYRETETLDGEDYGHRTSENFGTLFRPVNFRRVSAKNNADGVQLIADSIYNIICRREAQKDKK